MKWEERVGAWHAQCLACFFSTAGWGTLGAHPTHKVCSCLLFRELGYSWDDVLIAVENQDEAYRWQVRGSARRESV